MLTLCPLALRRTTRVWNLISGLVMLPWQGSETLARVQAERSWTSCDLDVLAVRGSLVMLCGDARWKWTHGTRLGVEKEGRDGRMYLHDWWGAPVASRLVRREDERHSVVLAFAAKAGDSQASGSEPG